jgi:hypothetical protein
MSNDYYGHENVKKFPITISVAGVEATVDVWIKYYYTPQPEGIYIVFNELLKEDGFIYTLSDEQVEAIRTHIANELRAKK